MNIKKINNSDEDIKKLQTIAKQTFTETFGLANCSS